MYTCALRFSLPSRYFEKGDLSLSRKFNTPPFNVFEALATKSFNYNREISLGRYLLQSSCERLAFSVNWYSSDLFTS